MSPRLISGALVLIMIVGVPLAGASTVEAQTNPTATPTPTPTNTPTATATVMHAWQGYLLIEFNPAEPTLSKGVDEELEKRIREAFSQLAPERSSWPPYALQVGPCNLAKTACIVEARFDRMPDLAMVADRLGSRTATDRKAMVEAIKLTLFALGGTWEESQAACLEYLTTNAKDWQPEEPMEGEPGTREEPGPVEQAPGDVEPIEGVQG
jgi:hypothetical protein